MHDIITREITVAAPKERVYRAITDPKEIVTWFPDAIEGSLEVGEQPKFTFGTEHKTQIHVEAAQPFEYFAYRWIPGSAGRIGNVLTVPNTLVEFHIEELGTGTKITLIESGFASLPVDIAEQSFTENSGGWESMMARLEQVMNER